MTLALNFVAFQLGWLGTVISAAMLQPWLGAVLIAAIVVLHLVRAERPRIDAQLLLLCAVTGGVWDSVLVVAGWVSYPSGMVVAGLAPYWIVMMWLLFATTLNVSMAWLKGRPWLAALFGLVGGPLSYLAGQRLGAIAFSEPLYALTALGLGWAVMLPALMRAAVLLDGSRASRAVHRRMVAEKC